MTTYLIDVNVLIAILDEEHQFHIVAREWFRKTGHFSWLTCPTTENGTVRVMCQPNYPKLTTTPEQVLEALGSLQSIGNHRFVADSISLVTSPNIDRGRLLSSKQVTDTYLLAMATSLNAMLATLDRRLTPIAVEQGSTHLHNLLD